MFAPDENVIDFCAEEKHKPQANSVCLVSSAYTKTNTGTLKCELISFIVSTRWIVFVRRFLACLSHRKIMMNSTKSWNGNQKKWKFRFPCWMHVNRSFWPQTKRQQKKPTTTTMTKTKRDVTHCNDNYSKWNCIQLKVKTIRALFESNVWQRQHRSQTMGQRLNWIRQILRYSERWIRFYCKVSALFRNSRRTNEIMNGRVWMIGFNNGLLWRFIHLFYFRTFSLCLAKKIPFVCSL